MAERVSVYCPTKKEDLEVTEPFPAWEICPVCENFFGIGHKECFFTIRKSSEEQQVQISILAVAG